MVARHCELIFFFLTSPKLYLNEVEKAMIQVVEWHFEVIFCFLTNRKCAFFEVDKATIEVVERYFLFLMSSPKYNLGEFKKAMFQGFACHFELIFGRLTIPKFDLVEDEIAMFQGLP